MLHYPPSPPRPSPQILASLYVARAPGTRARGPAHVPIHTQHTHTCTQSHAPASIYCEVYCTAMQSKTQMKTPATVALKYGPQARQVRASSHKCGTQAQPSAGHRPQVCLSVCHTLSLSLCLSVSLCVCVCVSLSVTQARATSKTSTGLKPQVRDTSTAKCGP